MPLPISSRLRCYISLDRARQFQATDREKTLKTFINIFVLLQLPPFIHTVNLSITWWSTSKYDEIS